MPWLETDPVIERKRFIMEWLSGEFAVSELCRRHEISRKTGPASISHVNITRTVDVYANVIAGHDVGTVADEIERRLTEAGAPWCARPSHAAPPRQEIRQRTRQPRSDSPSAPRQFASDGEGMLLYTAPARPSPQRFQRWRAR